MEDDASGGCLELSVIIAARNAEYTIGEQLAALCSESWERTWEIIVVDNGSSDGTREVVRAHQRDCEYLRLIEATAGRGAGYARNEGVRQAKGGNLAFCDADDIVQEGWVAAIGAALADAEFVAGSLRFDGLNPEWLQTAFYSKPPEKVELFEGIFPMVATCNLGLRRQIFEQIGGFNETFLTGQDLELCLRLWAAGHKLVFVPLAVVQYRYRATLGALWTRSRQYGEVAPAIVRRLADWGGPRPPRLKGLRNYLWLIRRMPTLRSKAGRARWVVVAGARVGRIRGSIRHRVLCL